MTLRLRRSRAIIRSSILCRARYTEITGKAPVISGRQGAADTRFLNLYGNTPTVIFGPGSTAVMHADDEYVSIDDYLTAIKVMALAIYDWCNAEPIRRSA